MNLENDGKLYDPGWQCDGDYLLLGDDAKSAAEKYNVIPTIHRLDYIFPTSYIRFKGNVNAAASAYYLSGRASAENLKNILYCLNYDYTFGSISNNVFTLLDFAAGYGCVCRHFRNVLPHVPVHTIDIHPHAASFNENVLGCKSSISSFEPDSLNPIDNFDVVLALSFFSHIPKSMIKPWLQCLLKHTKPGGLLIFTTAGEQSRQISMSDLTLDEDGFGAIRASEQYDLPLDYYQHVVALPAFVNKIILDVPGAELKAFVRSFWWQHQDTYVVQRRA